MHKKARKEYGTKGGDNTLPCGVCDYFDTYISTDDRGTLVLSIEERPKGPGSSFGILIFILQERYLLPGTVPYAINI
jgi:hypothetical protein